jgi:hypothetical protein
MGLTISMADIPIIPVYDPIGAFLFIFLPGFILLKGIQWRKNSHKSASQSEKTSIKGGKNINEEIESLLMAFILGLIISLVCSFVPDIWIFFGNLLGNPHLVFLKYDQQYKSYLIGLFSLVISSGLATYFYFYSKQFGEIEPKTNIKNILKIGLISLFTGIISGFIFLCLINYTSISNPLIPTPNAYFPYIYSCYKTNFVLGGQMYNNTNVIDVAGFNPRDYPLIVQVVNESFSRRFDLLQKINNSFSKNGFIIIPPKDTAVFSILLDDSKTQGTIYFYTVEGTQSLQYKC